MKFELEDHLYDHMAVVDDALRKGQALAVARALTDGDDASLPPLLASLDALGVTGLTVPEDHGGSGLALSDCVLMLEGLGRHLVPDLVAEGLAVVAPLLARYGEGDLLELLDGLADGSVRVSIQDGWSGWASWASFADVVAVVAPGSVDLVAPGAEDVTPLEGIDQSRRPGRVAKTARLLGRLDAEAADEARLRATVAAAASLSGVARGMITDAAAYTSQRRQFGTPVGAFQGVKHPLADAFSAVESARRTAWWAALSLDTDAQETLEAVSTAKALLGDAARQASYACLQAHGGIGYTWGCDVHLWMRRAQVLEAAWGSTDEHWRRLDSLV